MKVDFTDDEIEWLCSLINNYGDDDNVEIITSILDKLYLPLTDAEKIEYKEQLEQLTEAERAILDSGVSSPEYHRLNDKVRASKKL